MFIYMSHIVYYILAIISEVAGIAFFKLGYGIPTSIEGVVFCLAGINFFVFGIFEGRRRKIDAGKRAATAVDRWFERATYYW